MEQLNKIPEENINELSPEEFETRMVDVFTNYTYADFNEYCIQISIVGEYKKIYTDIVEDLIDKYNIKTSLGDYDETLTLDKPLWLTFENISDGVDITGLTKPSNMKGVVELFGIHQPTNDFIFRVYPESEIELIDWYKILKKESESPECLGEFCLPSITPGQYVVDPITDKYHSDNTFIEVSAKVDDYYKDPANTGRLFKIVLKSTVTSDKEVYESFIENLKQITDINTGFFYSCYVDLPASVLNVRSNIQFVGFTQDLVPVFLTPMYSDEFLYTVFSGVKSDYNKSIPTTITSLLTAGSFEIVDLLKI